MVGPVLQNFNKLLTLPVHSMLPLFITQLFRKHTLNKSKKRLIENFLSLSIFQALNYLLPLATLPYLARVLQPDKFGLVAFATAFVIYFQLITDYGFSISATKEVSIHRTNKKKLSEIFSSVFCIKFLFLGLTSLLFLFIISTIPLFKTEFVFYLFTFGLVIGETLFPVWFFQGIEKMHYIPKIRITTRFLAVIAIFLFINSTTDYLYVPLINSIGAILSGIFAFFFVMKKFTITFIRIPLKQLIYYLKKGWHIFFPTIAISLYTVSSVFILGIFTTTTSVGYYAAGEKIVKIALLFLIPFSQSIFPYISKLAKESKEQALSFIKKLILPTIIITFFISLSLFLFATPIAHIILGRQFEASILVIRILSFSPFFIALGTIYATFFLLAFDYIKQWQRIILFSAGMSILGAFFFVKILGLHYIGLSINILLTEFLVCALSFVQYRRLSRKILIT